jgi:hypothetical protein
MTNLDKVQATMSIEAKLKGPAILAVCSSPRLPMPDAEPHRNTRETFAQIALEIGTREQSSR